MVENWNEYQKKREQEKQERETITKDSLPEWVALKGFAASLAEDGKGVEGFKFQWMPDAYSPCLVLGAIAAYFEHREKNGKLETCHVRFDRKPLPPGRVWTDGRPAFLPVEWTLEPTLAGDGIQWMVDQFNAALNRKASFPSSDLAGKVGIKLAELLDIYNQMFPNWNLSITA
jgi:hypothetical protein